MNRQFEKYLTKAAPAIKTLERPADITFSMLKFDPVESDQLKAMIQKDEIPDGYVAGWASTPDLDLYHHVIKVGAFDDAIRTRGLSGPKSVKLLIGHDWNKVAGVIRVLETRQQKLWIEAQLNLNISYSRDAYEASKMAGGLNFSVGFMLQDYGFKEDDNKNEFLQIDRGDLFEVSIVPFPGNEECTMDVVKSREAAEAAADEKSVETLSRLISSFDLQKVAEFEKALVACGLAKSRNEAKRTTLAVKCATTLFRVEKPAPTPPAPEIKPETPLLAANQLDELTSLVAKMRKVLAPVATT